MDDFVNVLIWTLILFVLAMVGSLILSLFALNNTRAQAHLTRAWTAFKYAFFLCLLIAAVLYLGG